MRTVADAMSTPVVIGPSATLQQASAAMLDGDADAAIVARNDAVCGLLGAEDVAQALADGCDPAATSAIAIAAADPPRARADELLAEVHMRMRAAGQPRAVVVGHHGEPLGLLTEPEA